MVDSSNRNSKFLLLLFHWEGLILWGKYEQGKYTAILRKFVGKNVHATIPKGNMGYNQFTVSDTVAVELSFVAFL